MACDNEAALVQQKLGAVITWQGLVTTAAVNLSNAQDAKAAADAGLATAIAEWQQAQQQLDACLQGGG